MVNFKFVRVSPQSLLNRLFSRGFITLSFLASIHVYLLERFMANLFFVPLGLFCFLLLLVKDFFSDISLFFAFKIQNSFFCRLFSRLVFMVQTSGDNSATYQKLERQPLRRVINCRHVPTFGLWKHSWKCHHRREDSDTKLLGPSVSEDSLWSLTFPLSIRRHAKHFKGTGYGKLGLVSRLLSLLMGVAQPHPDD